MEFLCKFKWEYNLANGAKQWSNNKLSSLGRTCAGFMRSPACTKKSPSSRSWWMKAVTRGHHPSRKITPVCWGGTQEGMLYPTASLQMEVSHPAGSPADGSSPSPFQQFPLPSCPASCGIPSCSRCWSDFTSCGPPMPFHLQLPVPMWTAFHSTPRVPERPAWHFPLASRLSVAVGSKEYSGDLLSTQPQAMHRLSWNCPRSGYRPPDPACILGVNPAWVSLLSCKKNSETKGKPYHILPELIQFPCTEGLKYSFVFYPFHSNILRHNLEGFF